MSDLVARPATLADAEFLRRLRNDPETVAGSVNASPVTPRAHYQWLSSTLRDPLKRLMIVSDGVGASVATYRLDDVGCPESRVSLTVAPEARGQGFAALVIRLAATHAVLEGAEVVSAVVRVENARSRRAFKSAGFRHAFGGGRSSALGDVAYNGYKTQSRVVAGWLCSACAAGVPHHTNSVTSIGGDEGRHARYDLHVGVGGGLEECLAGDLLLAWERARAKRTGGRGRRGTAAGIPAQSEVRVLGPPPTIQRCRRRDDA